jgi:tripartite-type tricarboxylate transporter receptor subunit TctC
MARFIAEALKQRTGRNVIIDNKTGASGTLAGEALKNSPPDGTTVCYMPSATVVQKLTMPSIPFDPQTDLMPITLAGTVQTAFCVSPTIGVSTLKEYIEWLKNNPARASFGTTAMGSFTHFFGVMTGQAIGIPLEPVPYRGAAPRCVCRAAYRGGLRRYPGFLEHHPRRQGEGAIHPGEQRTTAAPDIPTGSELGYPSLAILGWYVFFAPPKTPPALIDAWGNELRAVLKLPEIDKKLTEFGLDVETSTPAEVSQRMARDFTRRKSILDSIGYKPAQ